ncbi:hypothetical protein ACFOVU_11420 [Nocardiopsis sediminis]|uniref:Uncharacterized protein n=1 Tax=Nocardiopsis sediminis TaxID=1778267 RepID=A0ABV8FMB4_9ACTN
MNRWARDGLIAVIVSPGGGHRYPAPQFANGRRPIAPRG